MEILIGLVMIVGGLAFAAYQYRRTGTRMQETQYMQTSSISDALEIMDTMEVTDPFYRHYVELKGSLVCDSPLNSPYANRAAAYYTNHCLSVSEQTSVYHDDDGNRHTSVTKHESEISNEHQSTEAYLRDGSCDVPVYVNFDSFGGDIDLVECCDRFEPVGSSWSNHFGARYSSRVYGGGRFLGYRLIESIFPANCPVYVLGELVHMGDRYVIEKAQLSKKPSLLSYKSEEQIVQDHKNSQLTSLIVGGVLVLIGIVVIVMRFS